MIDIQELRKVWDDREGEDNAIQMTLFAIAEQLKRIADCLERGQKGEDFDYAFKTVGYNDKSGGRDGSS